MGVGGEKQQRDDWEKRRQKQLWSWSKNRDQTASFHRQGMVAYLYSQYLGDCRQDRKEFKASLGLHSETLSQRERGSGEEKIWKGVEAS